MLDIKEKVKEHESQAELNGELKLEYALKRRGLAFDMAKLMSFEVHELLREKLLTAMLREPPPGYAKVSWTQIKTADEQFFKMLLGSDTWKQSS